MKFNIAIDYDTGQDVDILVDRYLLKDFCIVLESDGTTAIYPFSNIKKITITVNNG